MAQEETGKRAEIKALEKRVFATVCITAAAFGIIIVGGIYMVKTIIFKSRVLEAKAETVQIYKDNTVAIRTLNERVLGLATNEDLEVVAMDRDKTCMTLDGHLADFSDDIGMARKCSALRVLPDAMPWRANASALGASLGELLKHPGIVKETDAVGNSTGTTATGSGAIDISFSVRGSVTDMRGLLERIERSIRPIVYNTANFEWRSSGEIALSASSNAYFVSESSAVRKTKVVKMEDKR